MLLLFILACKVEPSKTPPQDSLQGTDSNTSDKGFCAVKHLLDHSCTACHSSAGHAGNLDLQTDPYTALVNKTANYPGRTLVIPGDSANSFLYIKMLGNQQVSEGGVMPPNGSLATSDLALISTWIDGGASDSCVNESSTTDSTGTRYHPSDFADPVNHGMDAKYQRDTCISCHGADLSGGSVGVSCDSCHPSGWRSDCVFCHGGTDNTTGAPPSDIDNLNTSLSFSPHGQHVTQGDHPAYDCVQCHVKPTDVTASGHFIVGDATPGLAEVSFSGGLSAAGQYNTGTCSNLYCHGNGQGDNGTVSSSASVGCGDCHGVDAGGEAAWNRMSGQHQKHMNDARLSCDTCHGTVTDGRDAIIGPTLHVDGTVQVTPPSEISYNNGNCTGSCHGRQHVNWNWLNPP